MNSIFIFIALNLVFFTSFAICDAFDLFSSTLFGKTEYFSLSSISLVLFYLFVFLLRPFYYHYGSICFLHLFLYGGGGSFFWIFRARLIKQFCDAPESAT